jgi:hypothetical protein
MHLRQVSPGRFAALGLCLTLLAGIALPDSAVASPLMSTRPLVDAAPDLIETVQHRRGVARRGAVSRRGFVARGPRGGVVAGRRAAVVRPGYRPSYRPVRPLPRPVVAAPGWRRPAGYWWRPGGAIAAGAALGFVTAAAATAYVGQPPAPGYCWYYTNPQRTQGFWDICPR